MRKLVLLVAAVITGMFMVGAMVFQMRPNINKKIAQDIGLSYDVCADTITYGEMNGILTITFNEKAVYIATTDNGQIISVKNPDGNCRTADEQDQEILDLVQRIGTINNLEIGYCMCAMIAFSVLFIVVESRTMKKK